MNRDDFVKLNVDNEARHIARDLRREKVRRELVDSIDTLTLPPEAGADIPVRRLPPTLSRNSRDFYRRLQLRESLLAHSDAWNQTELEIALLWLRGYSPRAIFATLGIPSATGYRRYGIVIRQLEEVCRE